MVAIAAGRTQCSRSLSRQLQEAVGTAGRAVRSDWLSDVETTGQISVTRKGDESRRFEPFPCRSWPRLARHPPTSGHFDVY